MTISHFGCECHEGSTPHDPHAPVLAWWWCMVPRQIIRFICRGINEAIDATGKVFAALKYIQSCYPVGDRNRGFTWQSEFGVGCNRVSEEKEGCAEQRMERCRDVFRICSASTSRGRHTTEVISRIILRSFLNHDDRVKCTHVFWPGWAVEAGVWVPDSLVNVAWAAKGWEKLNRTYGS